MRLLVIALITFINCISSSKLTIKPTVKIIVACWKRKGRTFEDWFRTALFTSCEVDYICFQELEQADSRGDISLINKYLAPGSFFVGVVDPAEPFCCGIAKILLDLCDKYNVSSSSLYFGHTGDESRPPFPHLESFYLKFKKVYRNFWWEVEPLQRLRSIGRLDWFPLGPIAKGNSSYTLIPSSQRSSLIYFSGSKRTNSRRPGQVGYIGQVLNLTVVGGIGASKSYIDDLRTSVFCINIRGTSAECFRFYESIEAGCIPLMMDQYHDFDYSEQHRHQFSILLEETWGNRGLPFIWSRNSTSLRSEVDSFIRSGEDGLRRLDEMQRELSLWYERVKDRLNRIFSRDMCV